MASVTFALLGTLPWIVVCALAAAVRFPRKLPRAESAADTFSPDLPLVSVIVPARNEEACIGECVGALSASRYPRFEIIVVDDRSEDETGSVARGIPAGAAERIAVLNGVPLPDGWLGKPWACWQGYLEARGDLLLFTDADTVHAPDLLERAVLGLDDDEADGVEADGVTVMGRQLMITFWEKVLQPQIFALLALRFSRLDRPARPGRCGDALANGQFILLRRESYEAVGGHGAVRGEVVEDLRLAQILCREGHHLSIREAEDALETRMYRSLGHMVEGWTKNLSIGARQTLPPWAGDPVLFLTALGGAILWLAPPAVLGFLLGNAIVGMGMGMETGIATATGIGPAGVSGGGIFVGLPNRPWLLWSLLTCSLSLAFWIGVAFRARINPVWGVFYPIGSALALYIFLRSWLRGTSVEWKGRRYEVDVV